MAVERGMSSRVIARARTRPGTCNVWCTTQRGGRVSISNVTPHRLRASVATLLLDAGMPLDQVQKFLRHKRITATQIYADTSLHGMSEHYIQALGGKA
jgi:site-specific recombinase XerD